MYMSFLDFTHPLTWIGLGIATSFLILAIHEVFFHNNLPPQPPEEEFTVRVQVEWPD
jgi:hypothetical protein